MGRILGVITEYNPFHNGHRLHLEESKRATGADTVVAVMSGDFVQRGEPALMDKWARADAAVKNGVDLVIELPFAYACNNAEYFANGAVRLLDGLGCVDCLCFGSESGDIDALSDIAEVIAGDNMQFNALVRDEMNTGVSYPKGRQNAAARIIGADKAAILGKPNNLLGTEYLKQLYAKGSMIEPYTIMRTGPGPKESDREKKLAGASAIRDMLGAGDEGGREAALEAMPAASRRAVKAYEKKYGGLMYMGDLFQLAAYSVLSRGREELAEILSATEGLENRLADSVKSAGAMKEMISYIKTKRYTETRVKRLIVHALVGLTKTDMGQMYESDLYGRVLAFGPAGSDLLGRIKRESLCAYPIVTNLSKQRAAMDESAELRKLIELDIRASEIYQLVRKGSVKGFYDEKFNPETKEGRGGRSQ